MGGGERAEAILAVFVLVVPAAHGGSGLAGCLALLLWFKLMACLAAHRVAHGRTAALLPKPRRRCHPLGRHSSTSVLGVRVCLSEPLDSWPVAGELSFFASHPAPS